MRGDGIFHIKRLAVNRAVALHKDVRLMPLFLLAFCTGVASLLLWPVLPSPLAPLCLLLVLPFCRRWPVLRALPALGLGMAYAVWQAGVALDSRIPSAWEQQPLQVQGQVVGLPEPTARGGVLFRLRPERVWWAGQEQAPPGRLWQLSTREPLALRPGELWRLDVRLRRPHGWSNPGGFDYEVWLLQEGVAATGYVRQAQRIEGASRWSLDEGRLALRERFVRDLGGSESAAVLLALLSGDRALVSDAAWERYAATGVSHLMAISGLHITLIAILVAGLSRWLLRRCWPSLALSMPLSLVGLALGGMAALAYGLLAGMSLPTQRTLLMLMVVSLGLAWRRDWGPWLVLGLALSLVLLWQPLAVHAIGLWLSFAAVALLVLLAWPRPGEVWWRAWGRSQWLMSLGLLPLTVLIFGRVSWLAPLANLLAIPLVTFVVVPLALLGLLFLPIWAEAGLALWSAAAMVLTVLDALLAQLQSWPAATQHWSLAPGAGLWLGLAVACLLLPRGLPGRWLAPVFLLPVLWGRAALPEGAWRFTLLDVGQGLAAVIETRRHVLVYDTGPVHGPDFDAGSRVVLPYLRWAGHGAIDRLMLSHAHQDHIGGAPAVLAQMPVGVVLGSWPQALAEARPRQPRRACQAGQHWHWDGVDFEVLYPWPGHAPARENDRSCVLRVSAGGHSLLLPGDVEWLGEWALRERSASRLPADLLVLAHHGSATSSHMDFLRQVAPREALVSAGYRHAFRHPSAQVLGRLELLGIAWLETASSGAVQYELWPGQAARRRLWRLEAGHYWLTRP